MKEAFLHYLWKYQLFEQRNLKATGGQSLEVISPGMHNKDAGPDFINARIRIHDTTWAGNVEIHVHASDWEKHGHHRNEAYDNVILQVVYTYDKQSYNARQETIPTLVLPVNKYLLENYEKVLSEDKWIPCQDEIRKLDECTLTHWTERLGVERLIHKTAAIALAFKQYNNHWEEVFYQKTARSFGLKINAEPFEMLAKSLPLKILSRHRDNLLQVEALLFGQAGFLNEQRSKPEYYLNLQKEYAFLKAKFKLRPIDIHLWKFLRLRPVNFPTLRISQFASLLHHSSALFSKIIHVSQINAIYRYFDFSTSGFWNTHYTFDKASTEQSKRIGKSFVHTLIINTIVPFIFFYGSYKDEQQYRDNALHLIQSVPPENNRIIKKWRQLGIKPENAFVSQALIELTNRYCNKKKCLDCEIGNKIIIVPGFPNQPEGLGQHLSE